LFVRISTIMVNKDEYIVGTPDSVRHVLTDGLHLTIGKARCGQQLIDIVIPITV